jgi:hypothetical protein
MKTKNLKTGKLLVVAAMGAAGVLVSLIFIYTYRSDSHNQPDRQIVLPPKPSPGSDTAASPQRMAGGRESSGIEAPAANKVQAQNTQPAEQRSLSVYNSGDKIVEGVGLSENELKALHLKQRLEMKKMAEDRDSIVIVPSQEADTAFSLGELLALHSQQRRDMAGTQDFDEIVILSSDDADTALTRQDLDELHQQQRLDMANAQDWDQIVIPESDEGEPALSWDEVATLQELQDDGILVSAEDPDAPAAPPSEYGGPDMTVHELKSLHMKQSVN